MQTGNFFSDPQITCDAEHAVWLIVWLEIPSGANDFIDIAINPSGNPLGSWLEYQIDSNATGANDFCDYPTMGYDYWAMWVSCISFDGS